MDDAILKNWVANERNFRNIPWRTLAKSTTTFAKLWEKLEPLCVSKVGGCVSSYQLGPPLWSDHGGKGARGIVPVAEMFE